jgi:hypothetical protein
VRFKLSRMTFDVANTAVKDRLVEDLLCGVGALLDGENANPPGSLYAVSELLYFLFSLLNGFNQPVPP